MTQALVIGGGPAGLMAAETLASLGISVTVCDAMPSVGRKFLMAGKSGLNLTKDEPSDAFMAQFQPCPPSLMAALQNFGPDEVMAWARGLGQTVFTGSSGRVFPEVMKASPLLRAWLVRLSGQGVQLKTRWRWTGTTADGAQLFETPQGPQQVSASITVLAMGGASWAKLGSTGDWARAVAHHVAPFTPANCGLGVDWSPHMASTFGQPVKGVALTAGSQRERGEFVVTKRGVEGGGIYAVSRAARLGIPVTLDLFPDLSVAVVRDRLARPRGKASLSTHLRKVLGLDGVRAALLMEWGRPLPQDLAPLLKALPLPHTGPMPIDEAISTGGGVRFDSLTSDLMLRDQPGVFCAGEMLDWEAPTGGYLLTACLATGLHAGLAAGRWLANHSDIAPN